MNRFIPIIKNGNIDKSQFKRWTFNPEIPQSDVIAPFGGTIFGINHNKGLLKIKHNINGDSIITKIYDLDSITVSNGDVVKQGEKIGKAGSKSINLEIVDSGNLEQLITPFFTGSSTLLQKTSEYKRPEQNKSVDKFKAEKQLPKYSEKKNLETTKYKERKGKSKQTKKDYSDVEPFSFLDIGLLPLHLLRSGWNYLTKKKDDDDEKLNEEILKIKNLLK